MSLMRVCYMYLLRVTECVFVIGQGMWHVWCQEPASQRHEVRDQSLVLHITSTEMVVTLVYTEHPDGRS